jgi:hypothetical protein
MNETTTYEYKNISKKKKKKKKKKRGSIDYGKNQNVEGAHIAQRLQLHHCRVLKAIYLED